MITNISSFIKHTETNENMNSLKGVVTPYDQKFNRKEKVGFTLNEIVNNESLRDRFVTNSFPIFQVMENGEIFMDPVKRIIQTIHEYYIKWIILDDAFIPSHDHDYPFVNIPKSGYLMKVIIPKLYDNPIENDFSVEYVCDINNIQTETSDSLNNNQVIQNHNVVDVNMNEILTIEEFNATVYPKVATLIMNKNEFFKEYLLNIFDK